MSEIMNQTQALGRKDLAQQLHGKITGTYSALNMLLTNFCRLLKQMRDEKLYEELGHSNFDDYVEKECGIGARQAYTYIGAYEKLGEDTINKLGGVGITKIALLTQITPGDRAEFIEDNDLGGLSVSEIKALIAEKNDIGEQLSLITEEKEAFEEVSDTLKSEVAELQKLLKAKEAEVEALKAEPIEAPAPADVDIEALKAEIENDLKLDYEKAEKIKIADLRKELNEMREREVAAIKNKAADGEKELIRTAEERGRKQAEERAKLALEEAEEKAAKLQKQIEAATDKETVTFSAMFNQLQSTANSMLALVNSIEDAEKATKLRGAGKSALTKLSDIFN